MSGHITIMMLGDSSVGKSAILKRLVQDKFDLNAMTTIGAEKYEATVEIRGEEVPLKIWDTAGQERYRSLQRAYFQRANGFMLVFDSHEPGTFANMKRWMQDIQDNSSSEVKVVIAANKIDLAPNYDVTEVETFARNYGIPYYLTSARTGQSIREAFVQLSSNILEGSAVLRESLPKTQKLEVAKTPTKKSCC